MAFNTPQVFTIEVIKLIDWLTVSYEGLVLRFIETHAIMSTKERLDLLQSNKSRDQRMQFNVIQVLKNFLVDFMVDSHDKCW